MNTIVLIAINTMFVPDSSFAFKIPIESSKASGLSNRYPPGPPQPPSSICRRTESRLVWPSELFATWGPFIRCLMCFTSICKMLVTPRLFREKITAILPAIPNHASTPYCDNNNTQLSNYEAVHAPYDCKCLHMSL